MKSPFKTDRGYLIIFCFVWPLLFADLVQGQEWWLGITLIWAWVYASFRADGARDQPGFIDRFVRAATSALLIAVGVGVVSMIGVAIYWGVADGFADLSVRWSRADDAGFGSTDGRVALLIEGLAVLVVLIGTPLRLRSLSQPSGATL